MTANLVTGFGSMQDLMPTQAAPSNQASTQDFSQVLKTSTDNQTNGQKLDNGPAKQENTSSKADNADKAEKPAEVKEDTKAEKTETKDETSKVQDTDDKVVSEETEEISDETLETVAEVVATMVQTIAEVLDVPTEQVEEALDTLGIDAMELTDKSVIPEVVIELSDATDMADIMTDESLFADVKTLMDTSEKLVSELADEIGVPVEELKTQINDAVVEIKEGQNIEKTDDGFEIVTGAEVATSEMTEAKPEVNADAPKQGNRHDDGKNENPQASVNFTQTVMDQIKDAVADVQTDVPVSYASQTSMDEIMNQVNESLRMNMTEDITEMEMQLHPASLGNVRVQVAARDGVITANFTTQNEQVRQALEAQIVQLKEQMNEQGLKVEAVEVSVNAHAFEQNLEQGNNGSNQSEAEAKSKKVRSINLADLDDADIAELDEEDRVAADMMARQGNTVDYMA